jgi:hypothetical protein
MIVATRLSSPKSWHEVPGTLVRKTPSRPYGTCRIYPEGIIGLSLGFQPQEHPTTTTRPEWAEENL